MYKKVVLCFVIEGRLLTKYTKSWKLPIISKR